VLLGILSQHCHLPQGILVVLLHTAVVGKLADTAALCNLLHTAVGDTLGKVMQLHKQ
jgi:hypothetical protein